MSNKITSVYGTEVELRPVGNHSVVLIVDGIIAAVLRADKAYHWASQATVDTVSAVMSDDLAKSSASKYREQSGDPEFTGEG